MTVTDTLARDDGAWDINTGTVGVPVWTPIGGLSSWSYSPSKNNADTTKYSNAGYQSHLPASLSVEHSIAGLKQVDSVTGDRDAGQAAVEAISGVLGVAGMTQFRHTMAGGIVNTFTGSVTWTNAGGSNDDATAWEATILMSGPPTTLTSANVPQAPTVVTGTGGTGQISVTWTDGATVGTLFEVRIMNGATLLKSVISSNKPTLVTGLAAGSGRTCVVRSQNAAGWSALSAASSSVTVA